MPRDGPVFPFCEIVETSKELLSPLPVGELESIDKSTAKAPERSAGLKEGGGKGCCGGPYGDGGGWVNEMG